MMRFFSKSALQAAAISLAITGGTTQAQANDLLKGLIGVGIGVGVGCATGVLTCNGNRNTTNRDTTNRNTANRGTSTGISSAQRQQNMEVQSALNGFNFPAGTVDGALGPRSRVAIQAYQGYMNYPQTGQLTDYERQTLVDSWRQYQNGAGEKYPKMMQAVGARGLLRTQRDPNYPAQFGDAVNPYNNQNSNYASYNQNGTGTYTDNGNTTGQIKPLQPLKPLKPLGEATITAASHCELVELTSRTQGVINATNMTDPDQALSEKFCEARGFSISKSQLRTSQFAVSDNELNDICKQIANAHRPTMTGLSVMDATQVVTEAKTTTRQLGLDQQSAVIYGQICLGLGYRQDDSSVALGGALTLVAADQRPYGEVVAHHLRKGFGVTQNSEAAAAWYNDAVDSLESGAEPAFEPSTTKDRISVIRAAIAQGGLQADRVELPKIDPVRS